MSYWDLISALMLTLFVGLKLSGVIAWSWLWVLSPLWIPLALVLIVYILSNWK